MNTAVLHPFRLVALVAIIAVAGLLGASTTEFGASNASANGASSITLSPATIQLVEGSDHEVRAYLDTLTPGIEIEFTVISGPNAGVTATGLTTFGGQTSFFYRGIGGLGVDTIRATAPQNTYITPGTAKVTWIDSTELRSRFFEGSATVKVKNGNAYSTYTAVTCAEVTTIGRSGPIVDVVVIGRPGNEPGDCGQFCLECEIGLVLQGAALTNPPGSFIAATWRDEARFGSGWKTNPVKQTASQWQFTMKTPNSKAGAVMLNSAPRALQGGTTLTAKFIRGRDGFSFHLAGLAPLNDNGTPKVTVEIASTIQGMDSAPWDQLVSLGGPEPINESNSIRIRYSEAVVIDPAGATLVCEEQAIEFTITGQGTDVITIDPVDPLPSGTECHLLIHYWAITDTDTIDPPDASFATTSVVFLVGDTGTCRSSNPLLRC